MARPDGRVASGLEFGIPAPVFALKVVTYRDRTLLDLHLDCLEEYLAQNLGS